MNRYLSIVAALILSAGLAGCATTDEIDAEAETGEAVGQQRDAGASAGAAGAAEGAEASGAAGARDFEGDPLEDPASPLSQRLVYFEFDSSEIATPYVELLTAHGEYLAMHPEEQVTVEGHTDERGSREYNLALGERRAKAVEKVLLLNGAAGEQVSITSFGEEKPADPGHNEDAWGENRRAELVYER